MQFPVFITLHRSRRYRLLLIAVHLLAVFSVWQPAWPYWLPACVSLVMLGSMIVAWQQVSDFPTHFKLNRDGKLELGHSPDGLRPVKLQAGTCLLPGLCVLRYQDPDQLKTLILLSDSGSPEALRQFRVWLRWCAFTKLKPPVESVISPGEE